MNIIVMSPTYQRAVYTWERLQKIPKIWIAATKHPLTLTLFNGTKLILVGETESQRGKSYDYVVGNLAPHKSPNVMPTPDYLG